MNYLPIQPISNEALNVKSTQKSMTNQNNYHGPSFSENLSEIGKAVNLQVSSRASAAALDMTRQKEDKVKPYNFLEEEEEMLKERIDKIEEIMQVFQRSFR